MLKRGVVIGSKDKERFNKHELIAGFDVKLDDGTFDRINYCNGQSLKVLLSDFCLKHKLGMDFHEKLVKTVKNALNGREH